MSIEIHEELSVLLAAQQKAALISGAGITGTRLVSQLVSVISTEPLTREIRDIIARCGNPPLNDKAINALVTYVQDLARP